MAVSYRKPPVLAIEDLGLELETLRGDPIEELARFGARLMLMSYLEAEVSAHLGASCYERSRSRRGSRNGHRSRNVACGVGTLEVDYPKVRQAEVPFRSQVLADCLTFLRFPPRHWKQLRTSNGLERWLGEVRRRTRVIGRFPTEKSALSLVWSVLDQDARKWRGMVMDAEHVRLLKAAVQSFGAEPIVVKGFEELLAA